MTHLARIRHPERLTLINARDRQLDRQFIWWPARREVWARIALWAFFAVVTGLVLSMAVRTAIDFERLW